MELGPKTVMERRDKGSLPLLGYRWVKNHSPKDLALEMDFNPYKV